MRRALAHAGTGVALICAVLVVTAPSAQAAARDGVCEPGEFCLYYNSDLRGSVSDFDGSIPNYGSTQPACYEFRGPGNGQRVCVKNNAASAWNRTPGQVIVYYNSGYGGPSQAIASGVQVNLNATLKNENASHKFGPGPPAAGAPTSPAPGPAPPTSAPTPPRPATPQPTPNPSPGPAPVPPGPARPDPRWSRTDTGYIDCPASNRAVDWVGVRLEHPAYGNHSVWRVVPTRRARYSSVSDSVTARELIACTPWIYPYKFRSFQGLVDQFDCHDRAPLGLATGSTWDLEGNRGPNRRLRTWVRTRCGW